MPSELINAEITGIDYKDKKIGGKYSTSEKSKVN